jgi:peroxiredoxin
MKRSLGLLLCCALFAGISMAQSQTKNNVQSKGYSINVTIDEAHVGDTVFMKTYLGKEQELVAQEVVKEGGTVHFQSDTLLKMGMYSLDVKESNIDFLISKDEPQQFSLKYVMSKGLSSATYTGSPENQALVDYIHFVQQKQTQRQHLQERMQQYMQTPDSAAAISQRITAIAEDVKNNWTEMEKKYDGKMFGFFISSIREPIPEPYEPPAMAANPDSLTQDYYYKFFRDHFFDHQKLSSPYILRMPFYSRVITIYFIQVVKRDEAELKAQVDNLVKKTEVNKEVYRFTVRQLYDLFRDTPYPEIEMMSPYVGEKYIMERPEMWDDEAFVARTAWAVAQTKLNMAGTEATDLTLKDMDDKTVSLYGIEAEYTILYFFNPLCGACMVVTPEVHKTYEKYKDKGVKVMAVCMNRDKEVWTSYIKEKNYLNWINVWDADETSGMNDKYDLHAIPTIYLLDKDKFVLGRDLNPSTLELWLGNLTSE